MKILGIIPARFASTRFPEKLLKKIDGSSIVEMVYKQCQKTQSLSKIVVATDHQQIFDEVQKFGGDVILTSENHQSGTARCAEALKIYGGATSYDFVVNVQGDEPLISPQTIDDLCFMLDSKTEIASSYIKIKTTEDLLNPNIVKVVLGEKNQALYFSRSPIPHLRGYNVDEWVKNQEMYKHLGLYAFRTDVLENLSKLPVSKLEEIEKLEQLRWLANGIKIIMVETYNESIGIDTLEDFEKLRQFLRQ